MSHRLLFIPFPETGHLNPSFKLAKALRARGHEVLYASLLDWEGRVRDEGLGFVPLFDEACPRGFIQRQAAAKHIDPVQALINHVAHVTGGNPGLISFKRSRSSYDWPGPTSFSLTSSSPPWP